MLTLPRLAPAFAGDRLLPPSVIRLEPWIMPARSPAIVATSTGAVLDLLAIPGDFLIAVAARYAGCAVVE